MQFSLLDRYSEGNSLVHRLDPRTKFVAVFLYILAVAFTTPSLWLAFAGYFIIIAALVLLSRVSVVVIIKRSLTIIPFVLVIAVFIPFFKQGDVVAGFNLLGWQISVTRQGLEVLAVIMARAWLSISALILLTSTTRMVDLLNGLDRLHLPRVLVMIVSFMYRYLFVLVDEAMRLKQARDNRNFGSGHILRQISTVGRMAGTLFIRSYERGERVYAAMLSRGYNGKMPAVNTLAFTRADLFFGLVFGTAVIFMGVVNFLYR